MTAASTVVEQLLDACAYLVPPWVDDPEDDPSRYWHGREVTFDGTSTERFTAADIVAVHGAANSGDRWDGTVAAIIELADGRFVSWETFYGPTGNGFSEDAYGGDADVVYSASLAAARDLGLTDTGRTLLNV